MPDVEELTEGDPEFVVRENARRKVAAVAVAATQSSNSGDTESSRFANPQHGGLPELRDVGPGVVIGADTIVVLDGRIYGKPADRGEAEAMLRRLAGREHQVLTGVAVPGRVAVATTAVRFRPLDEVLLAWYLDSEEWRGTAGAYAIQGRGAVFVEAIHGDYLNVVGLPVTTLLQLAPRILTED